MIYFKTPWRHESDNEPVLLYSELDDDRLECRKVEIYRDGRMGFADKNVEFLGAMLGIRQTPSLEEIAALKDFDPVVIGQDEFNKVWEMALNHDVFKE
jgi:hypothetical protein